MLLRGGCKIDATDTSGWTPLMEAAWNGHHPVVDMMIKRVSELSERLANESPQDRLQSWLEDAAKAADLPSPSPKSEAAVAIEVIAIRASFLDAQDKDGWTALHAAAYSGHTRSVQLLRRAGADDEVEDINGQRCVLSLVLLSFHRSFFKD